MGNIILIGMMGSGKSTIAHALTYKDYDVIDTDVDIEEGFGQSIADIFESFGEDFFRDMETDYLKGISSLHNNIISTGGGMILRAENCEYLKSMGPVIYLKGSVDTLYNRLVNNKSTRPLLNDDSLNERLKILLEERTHIYEGLADIVITVDEKSVDEICEELYRKLS